LPQGGRLRCAAALEISRTIRTLHFSRFARLDLELFYLLYTAFINGLFKRCPHCGKIGSWRYDKVGSSIEEKDEDGALMKSAQPLCCRSCHKLVLGVWSDFDGRAFLKNEEEKTEPLT